MGEFYMCCDVRDPHSIRGFRRDLGIAADAFDQCTVRFLSDLSLASLAYVVAQHIDPTNDRVLLGRVGVPGGMILGHQHPALQGFVWLANIEPILSPPA